MVGSFEYKGILSSEFGIVCRSVSRPLLPSVRPRMMQILGKSGVIDYGGSDYDTRQIVMHIGYIGSSYVELRSRAREIAAWLASGTWEKLFINDEPDKYYLARVITGINFETMQRTGQADITFECQPFAYMAIDTGADPIWNEADFPWMTDIPWVMVESYQFEATGEEEFTFENPGTQEIGYHSPQGSKSQIKVVGSWTTLVLSLNGKTLTYTAAGSGELIIDNVYLEVTLDGQNKLSVMDGDLDSFLPITVGENTIQVTGTGLNASVTIDFTPAWL